MTPTVFLDDQALQLDSLTPDATVADLLNLAKDRLGGTGAVLVGLRRDQVDVPADELEKMLRQPVSDFTGLQLLSDRPERIVLEALRQVRAAFVDTFAEIQSATELLAVGKVTGAMQTLAVCVEVWGRTHTAIIQAGLLISIDFDELEIGGHRIAHWLGELAAKLRDLKAAVEARDLVLLGDILRYELDDTLQQWERMLDGFIAHVACLEKHVPA